MEAGQVAYGEYRDNVQAYRDVIRKARAHLELNLAKDVIGNKIHYCEYTSCKRKMREGVGLPQNMAGDLVTGDTEEEEVVSAAFALGFAGEVCFGEPQAPEMSGKVWTKEGLPLVGIRSGSI